MSKLTTHVLDTALGKPAEGVTIVLEGLKSSGFKEIGRDIVSLPSNIRKLGSSIWGGSDQPVTPSTQNSTPTLKPLAAQPTQQVGNYQIVGTGQQSSYGEIANIAPNTPAPTAKTTIAPNSVNVPYFGQTSTFSGSYEIVGPSK